MSRSAAARTHAPWGALPVAASPRDLVRARPRRGFHERPGRRWLLWFGIGVALGLAVGAAFWRRPDAYVQFSIRYTGARRIAVAGDWNGWDPTQTPMHRDASGDVWTAWVPLRRGERYGYSFVVDGRTRIADPARPPRGGKPDISELVVAPDPDPAAW